MLCDGEEVSGRPGCCAAGLGPFTTEGRSFRVYTIPRTRMLRLCGGGRLDLIIFAERMAHEHAGVDALNVFKVSLCLTQGGRVGFRCCLSRRTGALGGRIVRTTSSRLRATGFSSSGRLSAALFPSGCADAVRRGAMAPLSRMILSSAIGVGGHWGRLAPQHRCLGRVR